MINVISLSELLDYKTPSSLNFMIVRSMKNMIDGVQQFDKLAPSIELLTFWNSSQKSSEDWETFKKQFNWELQQWNAQLGLKMIAGLSKDYDINLICYCRDYTHCHRLLVAEELVKIGCEVNLTKR